MIENKSNILTKNNMFSKRDMLNKIASISFYVAIIIEMLLVIVDKSDYTNPFEGRLFQITFCLFMLKICFTQYTRKEWLTMIGFFILGFVSYRLTGKNEILRIVALVFACKAIDMKRCMKLVFWMTTVGCMILVVLSVTGIFGTYGITMDFGRGVVETRYTLGLGHPNALHCMGWALILLGTYVYKEKLKVWHFVFLMIGNLGLYALTDSRTSTLMITMTLVIMVIATQMKQEIINLLLYLGTIASVVFAVIFAVLSAIYSIYVRGYHWQFPNCDTKVHQFWGKIDQVLNGRIYILTDTINQEGSITSWTLFSSPEKDYYFDMGWVRIFYWYGIIPAIIYIVVLLLLIRQCYKQKDRMALCMILSFAIYTCIEAHMVSVYLGRDYILLLFGMYCCRIISSKVEKERYWWKGI